MWWPFGRKSKSGRGELVSQRAERVLNARFDLAQTNNSNKRYYELADHRSPRAALAPEVREKIRQRSRYEAENNSWYAGMLRTASNHIVGRGGPQLQVMTGSPEFNERLEKAWAKHAKRIRFAANLKLTVETDWRDGETVKLRVPREVWGGIGFDVRVYECDQLSSPVLYPNPMDRNWEDGIKLDPNTGEPAMYFLLDYHPGDAFWITPFQGKWYAAANVIHTFRKERPGQLRGVPRATPSLPLLPFLRRYKLATLRAAENAARNASYIKTNQSAQVQPAKSPQDFAQIELPDGTAMFLPEGWESGQVKPEHPTTVEEQFIRSTLTEFCRCTEMPLHVAMGTSKDSNFSSANLDFRLNWECAVEDERARLEEQDMNRQVMWFLEEAVFIEGLLDGGPPIDQIEFGWNWPPLPVTDPGESATVSEQKMASGQSAPSTESAKINQPYKAEVIRSAADHGVTPEEYLALVRFKRFGAAYPPAPMEAGKVGSTGTTQDVSPPPPAPVPGEFGTINRRQWQNNIKAIRDVLTDLTEGISTPGYALILLQSLGLSEVKAQALVNDARDGVIDDPVFAEATDAS